MLLEYTQNYAHVDSHTHASIMEYVQAIAVLAGRAAVPRAAHRRHPAIIHRLHHVPALEPETPNRLTVRLVRFSSVESHQVLVLAAHTVRPAVGAVVP